LPEKKFHILVAPLDWGIGHATRIVPIISILHAKGAKVTIAAAGRPLALLQGLFPGAGFVEAPGFRVTYPAAGSMALKMALSSPGILAGINREHHWLERFVSENGIDAVISDNRFGFWSSRVPSIYITHQVMVRMPGGLGFLEPLIFRAHALFIRKYSECWIPDFEGAENLSGDLSHRYPKPANGFFIGPLSRFNHGPIPEGDQKAIHGPDLLVLLSGPEPQRSIFERIILSETGKLRNLKSVVLSGRPGEGPAVEQKDGLTVYSHLPDQEIATLIRSAGHIICRPGYSTLMDLACLGRTATLVPTPGQTEQEYLAEYLSGKYSFRTCTQRSFSLEKVLDFTSAQNATLPCPSNGDLYESRINRLLHSVK
jgi:hypothetical protein